MKFLEVCRYIYRQFLIKYSIAKAKDWEDNIKVYNLKGAEFSVTIKKFHIIEVFKVIETLRIELKIIVFIHSLRISKC